jgi:predicted GH43/DUF377 family glycosyl hydrolase
MKWMKGGLVYSPEGHASWAVHSALQPTPLVLDSGVIRMYAGFRDQQGVSSVGFVDLDAHDPSRVLRVSERPVLTQGRPGTFDDNGVVPCAVVRRNGGRVFLYYAGYQLQTKIRFCAFGGLAISSDGGETFERYSEVPVVERTEEGVFFRVVHSIFEEDGLWRAWYGAGGEYRQDGARSLPVYDIRYMESSDGFQFPAKGRVALPLQGVDEHRIGRPFVLPDTGCYRMFFAAATVDRGFRLAYAESQDGHCWTRMDERLGLKVSDSGWDSKMMAYPAVVNTDNNVFLFYNGNDYGRAGFGYAILEEW